VSAAAEEEEERCGINWNYCPGQRSFKFKLLLLLCPCSAPRSSACEGLTVCRMHRASTEGLSTVRRLARIVRNVGTLVTSRSHITAGGQSNVNLTLTADHVGPTGNAIRVQKLLRLNIGRNTDYTDWWGLYSVTPAT
jgi:hypothetical protein